MINIKSILKFWKGGDGKKSIRVSNDPVCGMRPTEGIGFVHEDIKYSFCSDHCKEQFEKDPEAYITR
ncbi:MAG: YHS domain-containing protein [bacterium]|nr:YHS domain-containing protein [bacterium]